MRFRLRTLALLVLVAVSPAEARAPAGLLAAASPIPKRLTFAGTRILLTVPAADFTLSADDIADWVLRSARATTTFFGRFPVAEVSIAIDATDGDEVSEGVADAAPDAAIRVAIGRRTTRAALRRDSTMVHEMAHLGFPDIDDAHLWLHEGIATYIEIVARAQALEITPAQAWAHFAAEMPQGLPRGSDAGLDNSREDRRYWGGAMFCLIADIEIRRRTGNRFGLRDALRAVLRAGGTLAETWSVERALAIGDGAVGVGVLGELYATWRATPVAPDLAALWERLGIHRADGGRAVLIDSASLAPIRRAITDMPARPLLLSQPALLREATRR